MNNKVRNEINKQNIGLYEISVIAFFYILPAVSIIIENLTANAAITLIAVKWILFWGVGLRLFTCGLKQAVQPVFTASNIFEIREERAHVVVRELGFANISMGLSGILSIFYGGFRSAVWVTGLTYYALAYIQHIFRKEKNSVESFAAVTDLTIILELAVSGLLAVIG